MCGRIANRPDLASACSGVAALVRLCLAILLASMLPAAAQAQAISQFTNSTSGAIPESTTCATTLTRTFSVASALTVSDVDIGVLLSHNTRSHIRLSLTSPAGTTVNLITNSGGTADHINVLFDDEAAAAISTHTANDTITTVPPYQRTFRPASVLSAFDGQNAAGTWTLRICDSQTGTTGTFTRADLYITQPYADLSLNKTVSNSTPANGASASYTLTLTNASASPSTATGVTVQDTLPLGINFVSSSGDGSFNAGTGVWTVGSIPPGATRTLTINFTVTATAGATITNSAEVSASSLIDSDSTVNNGSTIEDDDAAVSFTVSGSRVAGIAPTLICPAGTTIHNWDTLSWTAGSTNNSYSVPFVGTTNFAITTTGGTWQTLALLGGLNPALQNQATGGLSPAQYSLSHYIDFTNTSQSVSTTVTLPTAVPGAQFTLFDVDWGSAQFADKITITGSYRGNSVTPILTNGVSNYVIGNSAYGDNTSDPTSANGNLVVTFNTAVDTITITYGNHSLAPADPGVQSYMLHDITMCRPVANLSVAKISSVLSDGVSTTNPKAIPGATVRYCITVSNAGSGTATSVSASDTLPATVTFVPGSMASGTSCGSASTVEDDNGTGTDETDPFGMVFNSGTITGTAATLAPGSTFAMIFNVTVN